MGNIESQVLYEVTAWYRLVGSSETETRVRCRSPSRTRPLAITPAAMQMPARFMCVRRCPSEEISDLDCMHRSDQACQRWSDARGRICLRVVDAGYRNRVRGGHACPCSMFHVRPNTREQSASDAHDCATSRIALVERGVIDGARAARPSSPLRRVFLNGRWRMRRRSACPWDQRRKCRP